MGGWLASKLIGFVHEPCAGGFMFCLLAGLAAHMQAACWLVAFWSIWHELLNGWPPSTDRLQNPNAVGLRKTLSSRYIASVFIEKQDRPRKTRDKKLNKQDQDHTHNCPDALVVRAG